VLLIHGIALPSGSGSTALATVMQVRLELAPSHLQRQEILTPMAPAPAAPAVGLAVAATPPARPQPALMNPGLAPPAIAQPLPTPALAGMPAAQADLISADSPEASVASPADPVHYAARDLDIFPHTKTPLTPAYPHAAFAARSTGFVTLEVLIDEAGRVVDTAVVDAAPDGVFEDAAQQTIAAAAFYPAQKDGRVVRSRVLVRIEFDPAGLNAPR
jgi:protein TonB